MKNTLRQLLMLSVIGSVVFLYSCGEDEEPDPVAVPSVSITGSVASGSEVEAGTAVDISVSITAPGIFNTLNITGSVTESFNRNSTEATITNDGATATFEFTLETSEDDIDSTIEINMVAIDDLDQSSAMETFTISVIPVPSPDAIIQTAIILAAPTADGSSVSFYSVSENTLYSHDDVVGTADPVSANIDLGYYYGSSDEATIISPSSYPSAVFDISAWGTKNTTEMVQLVDMSTEEFDALVSVADVEAVIDAIPEDSDVFEGYSGLEEGIIIAFSTSGDIEGIMVVRALETGFSGSIELEMILSEAAE